MDGVPPLQMTQVSDKYLLRTTDKIRYMDKLRLSELNQAPASTAYRVVYV